jgi:hypothetical protein
MDGALVECLAVFPRHKGRTTLISSLPLWQFLVALVSTRVIVRSKIFAELCDWLGLFSLSVFVGTKLISIFPIRQFLVALIINRYVVTKYVDSLKLGGWLPLFSLSVFVYFSESHLSNDCRSGLFCFLPHYFSCG